MKNDARKHVKFFFYVYVWEARFALPSVHVCVVNPFFFQAVIVDFGV